MSAPALWPWRVSSAARARVDFVVHRSGDIGSPRSSGSTRASSAGRSPGSRSAARLRPPPGRRARPSGSAPASSSLTPSDTVASRTPAARATSRIPPWPRARASAPISSRRCRSSRCGKIAWNVAASLSRFSSMRLYHTSERTPGKLRVIFRWALTYVTTMLDAGADLRDVQIAARHADPRTTMRYDRARQNLDRHPKDRRNSVTQRLSICIAARSPAWPPVPRPNGRSGAPVDGRLHGRWSGPGAWSVCEWRAARRPVGLTTSLNPGSGCHVPVWKIAVGRATRATSGRSAPAWPPPSAPAPVCRARLPARR